MKKVLLILIGLAVVGGIAWSLTHSKSETITQLIHSEDAYKSTLFGFEITPAEGFTVNESYLNQNLGPGREIPGIAFIIPEALSKGTNLSSDSYMAVEKLSDVDCEPATFLDGVKTVEDIVVHGITYQKASAGGAGAGNLYEETVYVTERNDACFAVREFVHTTQIGNYEPGTVKAYDAKALKSLFEATFNTLIFK